MKVNRLSNSPILDNGCYKFDNELFVTRELVYDKMYETQKFESELSFWFHDEYFDQFNWQVEPEISLEQLYINRAKQLREKYDYLILSFSGGTDSREVLYTFLNNDIFIDEIQTVNYSNLISKIDTVTIKELNFELYAEYNDCAVPVLKEVQLRSPRTKITLIDSTDFYLNEILSTKFSNFNPKYTKYPMVKLPIIRNSRSVTYSKIKYNEETINRNKKTAIIFGVEKPKIKLKDRKLVFCFNDFVYSSTKDVNTGAIDNYCSFEQFFWSKDAPLIPIKQSHVIKKVLENDLNVLKTYVYSLTKNKNVFEVNDITYDRTSIDRLFCPYIYKYTNKRVLEYKREPPKGLDMVTSQKIFNNTNPINFIDEYNSHIFNTYSKINREYLTKIIDSKYRVIGTLQPNYGA